MSYFLAHSDNAELLYDPVEGMEIVEDEVGEYRRIQLLDQSIWVMLDEANRIMQYGVRFSSTDYDNTMYNVNHSIIRYTMYEDYMDIIDVDITDEIRTMAEANSFPLE